jgi:hypothetical protein
MLLAAGTLLLGGCGGTRLEAQWSDPEFAGRPLRGAKVLVVCDGDEIVVRRMCRDRVARQLEAAGAAPVTAAEELPAGPTDRTLAAAHKLGATAIFGSTLAHETAAVGTGSTVGIGVGGGSGGGGVGISFPIGGGAPIGGGGYAANVVVTDVASGRLMWTGKVRTSSWESVEGQVTGLVRTAVEAVQKAGVL